MPKIVNHEQKREDIMKAAIKVFNTKGFEKTRISDISDETDISRTAVYQYFKDKEQLFEATVNYVVNDTYSAVNAIMLNGVMSNYGKINDIVVELLIRHKYTSIFLRLAETWIAEHERTKKHYKELETYATRMKNALQFLFEKASEEGEIDEVCGRTMSVILYTMIEGILMHFVKNENANMDDYVQSVNCLLNGIKTKVNIDNYNELEYSV